MSEPRALTPNEIKGMIDRLCPNRKKQPLYEKKRIDAILSKLRNDLQKIRVDPSKISQLEKMIEHEFHQSQASPGEMVGITCAQSIGERQTQMSVASDHTVWIRRTDRATRRTVCHYVGTIGNFIDARVIENQDNVVCLSEESCVLPTNGLEYIDEILAVQKNGMVRWSPIREYSRHPPNGCLQHTITNTGRKITTTRSHSLLTSSDPISTVKKCSPVIPIVASEIRIDTTPLPRISDRSVRVLQNYREFQPTRKQSLVEEIWGVCSVLENGRTMDRVDTNQIMRVVQTMCMLMESATHGVSKQVITDICCRMLSRKMKDGFVGSFRNVEEMMFFQILLLFFDLAGIRYKSVWNQGGSNPHGTVFVSMRTDKQADCWDFVRGIIRMPEAEYTRRHRHVYDLSVESETFLLLDGIFVHNTLNTFHSAGLAVQTVLSGVPRFMELLNATKEPRFSSTRFRIMEQLEPKNIDDIRGIIRNQMVQLTMKDLVKNWDVFSTPPDELWYDQFEMVYSDRFRDLEKGVRLFMDAELLFQYRIRLDELAVFLESRFEDIVCVFSPQHLAQLDIYIDTSLLQCADNVDETFINETNYEIHFIENVFLAKLYDTVVCGIPGIRDYVVQKEDGMLWVITNGNNFLSLMGKDWVDTRTACSNNMWDIYHLMGIEATRQFLMDEFRRVISSDGTFIYPSHISLLVDIMTHQGIILSVSRYGMKKEQTSPLAKASFEECLDHFLTAGFIGDEENIEGVSASIICGKRSKIGTGVCQLRFKPDSVSVS